MHAAYCEWKINCMWSKKMEPTDETHFAVRGIIYVKLYLPFLPPQLSTAGVIKGHVLFLPYFWVSGIKLRHLFLTSVHDFSLLFWEFQVFMCFSDCILSF